MLAILHWDLLQGKRVRHRVHGIAGSFSARRAVVIAGRDERPLIKSTINNDGLIFLRWNSNVEPCLAYLTVTFHRACTLTGLLSVLFATCMHLQLIHCGPIERVG